MPKLCNTQGEAFEKLYRWLGIGANAMLRGAMIKAARIRPL